MMRTKIKMTNWKSEEETKRIKIKKRLKYKMHQTMRMRKMQTKPL